MIEKKTNLFTDISGWQSYAMRSFSRFCHPLREMLDLVDPEAILFGTDGPAFRLYTYTNQVWVKAIQGISRNWPPGVTSSREEIDGMMGETARRILGL